jgi:NADPH:quinone reductase-like Zn-dependent oxidoreductase
LTELKNQIEQGNLKTTLTHRFDPLNADNLTKAFAQLMTGHTVGKIVLENVEK